MTVPTMSSGATSGMPVMRRPATRHASTPPSSSPTTASCPMSRHCRTIFGAVLVVAGDEDHRLIEIDDPPEHAPERRSQRVDTEPGTCAARVLRDGASVDHQRAGGELAFDLLDVEPGEIGQFVVSTGAAPVDLGEPQEVGGERPEPGEQRLDERVLVVDPERTRWIGAFVARAST